MSPATSTSELLKYAFVESAKVIRNPILFNPSIVEVITQKSGFNWTLEFSLAEYVQQPEYWAYFVVEKKDGPDWPPNTDYSPVILPTRFYTTVTSVGTKGIAVVGSNTTINIDYQLPARLAETWY